ncbi:MAG: hypothetical protein IJC89_00780 [Clostridia bacterium]|nr:hypothetical protein [Clostridia bacterium]
MKNICKKISDILKTIFGYGVMISLFVGGLTFFGYVVALFIGGNVATAICDVIYNKIFPATIYLAVIMVLLGLIAMYLAGEVALTPEKKQAHKHQGEM